MENAALHAYRANPTNSTFNRVYQLYRPWMERNGSYLIAKKFRALSVETDLPDLSNEGFLAMSRSARRFTFYCSKCPKVFLHRRALERHSREVHRVRGSSLVSLKSFAEISARLSMKRTAARLINPDIPTDRTEELAGAEVEDFILTELLIKQAEVRLDREARSVLRGILQDGLPEEVPEEVILRLRREFRELSPDSLWI